MKQPYDQSYCQIFFTTMQNKAGNQEMIVLNAAESSQFSQSYFDS